MKQRENVPTLERPLYLLEFFSESSPYWGLSDLARACGLDKATCLRSLRALENHGLVTKEDTQYRLGSRLMTLGSLVQSAYPARRLALPTMQSLRDHTEQSVQWVVREGFEGVYLDVVEATARVRLFIAPGRRAPLYAGASTRLLLAFSPPEVQAHVLEAPRVQFTNLTPTDFMYLNGLLEHTRRTGFAASFGELEAHSAEIAAPIYGAHGMVIAALSMAGARTVYDDPGALERYVLALDSAACALSLQLGFSKPWNSDPQGFLQAMFRTLQEETT
jgi:IclR family transcriptional regulator, KDG regulon repressor